MRLEVLRAGVGPRTVELSLPFAVVGRDPSCDLVLDDVKCSRRHAVIEEGPDGLMVRDSGSANGVFVNDERVERAALRIGDVIRVGDVRLRVLADGPSGPPPAPSPTRLPPSLSLLAALWLLSSPGYVVLGLYGARTASGGLAVLLALAGTALSFFALALAYGLWTRRRWAWPAQVGAAVLGLMLCPFTLASALVLAYMLRGSTRDVFAAKNQEGPHHTEGPFAIAIAASVILGGLISLALGPFLPRGAPDLVTRSRATPPPAPPGGERDFLETVRRSLVEPDLPATEVAAVERIKKVAAAEEAFRQVCNVGYADLESLLDPRQSIPTYAAGAPPFLPAEAGRPEADGYRFELSVEGRIPASADCAARRYRRYTYSATPLRAGRHFLLTHDGVVHAANGHSATARDPALE